MDQVGETSLSSYMQKEDYGQRDEGRGGRAGYYLTELSMDPLEV